MSQAATPNPSTDDLPGDILEQRAIEQRHRLHLTVTALRTKVADDIDVRKVGRRYFWQAVGAAALLGWILGNGAAGMFVR